MEQLSQMDKPKGYERWRVAQAKKARSARKRRIAERDNRDRIMERLARRQKRHRGETGLPQIITHATAERWKREPHLCPRCRGMRVIAAVKDKQLIKLQCPECGGTGNVYGRRPSNQLVVMG